MISEKFANAGIEHLYQLLFTKPKGLKDFSVPKQISDCQKDEWVLLECYPNKSQPINDVYPGRGSKIKAASVNWSFFSRDNHRIYTTIYSTATHVKNIKEALETIHQHNYRYYLHGKLTLTERGFLVLSNPEYVPYSQLGKLIPEYGTIQKIKNEEITSAINNIINDPALLEQSLQEMSPLFAAYSEKEIQKSILLASKNTFSNIKSVVLGLHCPTSITEFEHAKLALAVLAGLKVINDGKTHQRIKSAEHELTIAPSLLQNFIDRMPFKMTDEQNTIAHSMLNAICSPYLAKEILSADVGYGKTCVFGNVAAAVAAAGYAVIIYEPSSILANQVAENFKKWWPEIKVSVITSKNKPKHVEPMAGQIIIGTTAVNKFCDIWGIRPALVICDEEHKFGTKQRSEILESVNYISSTATCIPRTMQLGMLGAFNVHRITHCHIKKSITTTIRSGKEIDKIFNNIINTISSNEKAMIVYPLAEIDLNKDKNRAKGKNTLDDERFSAEAAYEQWNKAFPGRVTLVYGGMDPDLKEKNIESFRSGNTPILVATTAVEVGLDVPGLTYGCIVNAERHGLAGLHQLRGRISRAGGEGAFDLLIPVAEVPPHIRERLSILEKTMDGFAIAEHDLMIRGFGDLSRHGTEQSGALNALSLNLLVTPAEVKQAQDILDSIATHHVDDSKDKEKDINMMSQEGQNIIGQTNSVLHQLRQAF